ncbi:MAG: hypothetical protein J0H69_00415 [Burkholderiales bacterium]|jgi:hypothetical protein|nr:hypothetical protein [Burkholderiales bacterium]
MTSTHWTVLSRILAAVLGGHVLASALSVAIVALASAAWPMARADAALAAMQLSFLPWAAAVMWAFAARSAPRAWAGLAAVALPAAVLSWAALNLC